jgi:hypothetical protein
MKKNIGGYDGFLRMLVAMVLLFAAIMFGSWWLVLFGVPLVVTNFMMYCPIYDILGLDFSDKKA